MSQTLNGNVYIYIYDRISKEKEVMEILRIRNLMYDRIFQFTNCSLN